MRLRNNAHVTPARTDRLAALSGSGRGYYAELEYPVP
jgi:hypothetical protein